MVIDWVQIALGAGGLLAIQSVQSGFPLLSRFAKNHPNAAPAVNAAESALTAAAKAVNPAVNAPQTGLSPLLTLLGGALSHINDLQTLQSYLTQLHLTPLPQTASTPPVNQPTVDPLTEILARVAKLEAAQPAK